MNELQKELCKSYCKDVILPLGNMTIKIEKLFLGIIKDAGKATCNAFIEGTNESIEKYKTSGNTTKKITKKSKKSSYSFEFDQEI